MFKKCLFPNDGQQLNVVNKRVKSVEITDYAMINNQNWKKNYFKDLCNKHQNSI